MLQRSQLVSWLASVALVGCAAPSEHTESASIEAAQRADDLAQIRKIEDHRAIHDPDLGRFLASPSPTTVAAALVAVGRIGDTTYRDRVIGALGARDAGVRAAAAFASQLLGGDALRAAVEAALRVETDRGAVTAQSLALGKIGNLASLAALSHVLASDVPVLQANAAEAIGALGIAHRDLVVDAATLARLAALAGSREDAPAADQDPRLQRAVRDPERGGHVRLGRLPGAVRGDVSDLGRAGQHGRPDRRARHDRGVRQPGRSPAEVIDGMDVVDRLEVGDRIVSATAR
jgi:HEAT repeat protein